MRTVMCAERCGALGTISEPAVEPLITALNDTSEYVRVSAAEALGSFGGLRAGMRQRPPTGQ